MTPKPNHKNIRILFIHHSSELGGAENSLMDLLDAIKNFPITPVVVLPEKGAFYRQLNSHKIATEIVPMPQLNRSDISPVKLWKTYKEYTAFLDSLEPLIEKVAPNLIHCNSRKSFLLFADIATRFKKPIIWHERDLAPVSFIEKAVAKQATAIVAISKTVEDHLKKALPKNLHKRLTLIYNGIPTEKYFITHPKSRLNLDLPPKGDLIIVPAQFVPWKNHKTLIEAAKIVHDEIPTATFLCFGRQDNDEFKKYVKKLKRKRDKLELSDTIFFHDWEDDIASVYAHASAVVLPSINEPFGRVVIEAMAAKKVIIAMNTGGPAEIIKDNVTGLLSADSTPKELANRIIFALNQPLTNLNEMGKVAELYATQHFHINKTAREFLKLITTLLKK